MVTNDYGTVVGDGCLSVIDKIVLGTRPNSMNYIEPAVKLDLDVDATTDELWQNQLKFQWYWYDQVEDDQTKEKQLVQRQLPPAGELGQYFSLSQNGKKMVITFPEVPEGEEKAYNTYYAMKDRSYTIVISHKYDRLEYNFTINGINLVKPGVIGKNTTKESSEKCNISTIIGVSVGANVLVLLAASVVVVIMYRRWRNKDGKNVTYTQPTFNRSRNNNSEYDALEVQVINNEYANTTLVSST